jgi:small-conductance mechanosensitive channel
MAVATEIQKSHKGAAKKHHPTVRFTHFGESGIGYEVKLRVLEYDWRYEIKHDLIKALHRKFREEGIEIPFPVRTIRMETGGDLT